MDIEPATFGEAMSVDCSLTNICWITRYCCRLPRRMIGDWDGNIVSCFSVPAELPHDEARQQLDGDQVIDPVQLTVKLQVPEVGVGHPQAERGQTFVGQSAAPGENRVIRGDRVREQLVALDPDPEFTLQAEHDIQEVDGLRPQVSLQGGGGDDVVFLDAQRLHQHFPDPRMNLVCVRHGLVPSREMDAKKRWPRLSWTCLAVHCLSQGKQRVPQFRELCFPTGVACSIRMRLTSSITAG